MTGREEVSETFSRPLSQKNKKMEMKLKRLYFIVCCSLLAGGLATSCGDDKVEIPPAIEPDKPEPDKPDEEIYNKPEFPLREDGKPYDTYRGLVMAGYQGWFGAPGDGCKHSEADNTAWYHYRESEVFKPGVLQNSIDMWPDMSEYTKKYTPGVDGPASRSAKFTLPNGEAAQVYSSYDESSVLLHFKWMQDYGIDGVFMQRFVGEVAGEQGKDHFNTVLKHAMKGSNQYQRAISVMYDLGGFEPGTDRDEAFLLADAQYIMDTYKLKDRNQQKFYLHEDGKPLLALWGVGFEEKPFDVNDITSLVNALKEQGWSIMLGVNDDWRTHNTSKWPKAKYHELIKNVSTIFPWFVGRYGDINGYVNDRKPKIDADIKLCKTYGVNYAPHCFPGASDLHMHPNNVNNAGSSGRVGGKFFWEQIYGGIKLGAEMLYIAMFDEIVEGTAIFKCLNQKDAPSNVAETDYYVWYNSDTGGYGKSSTMRDESKLGANGWCRKVNDLNIPFYGIEDHLPTDHYLWLTGQARKMLRGEVPLKNAWPSR